MSDTWMNNDELVDLLIKESTEGLTAEESAALAEMARSLSDDDRRELEHVVAAATLAALGPLQKMPDTTRQRVLKTVPANVTSSSAATISSGTAPRRSLEAAGWWAAAACFVLAVAGWWPRLLGDGGAPMAQRTPDPQAQREQLLERENTLRASWSAGPALSDQPLIGDVVFDPVTQRGVLRFRGLPANDPRAEQYQLWIADASRQYPEPVDGGVFDVATTLPNGDVLVPFEAKLPVGSPAVFVVTAEKPGGVVVSRQEKVLALAKVE